MMIRKGDVRSKEKRESVLMINYQTAEEGVAELISAIKATFAALETEHPKGIRYAYWRRADSTEFVALLELDEGIENPLPDIAIARELRSTVAKWVVGEPPIPQSFQILGSYGFS
jgi:hypothetical protein